MSKGIYTSRQKELLHLLRQLREDANISQKQLAERINRSQSFISKYENGELRLDLLELYEICEATNVSLQDFIRRFEGKINEGR